MILSKMMTTLHSSPAFNIPWTIATCLCIWFLFLHAPHILSAKDYIQPLLYVHLIGAYSIYMACVHNTFVTPSTCRPLHVWIGRIGLVLGVMGFVTGSALVWFVNDFRQNWGFSIGITYGGFAQMQLQFMGYRAIRRFQNIKAQIDAGEYKNEDERMALQEDRDAQLKIHITSMINLFVLACGIPALIRICDGIGYAYIPILVIVANCLSYFMARPFLKKMESSSIARLLDGYVEESTLVNK
mmetsp:Transcript_1774/g.2757  ORF Transcript_1774/g.2757 Transcript_1774/m.2757 type:complete len:242 (+) Transcript_1774:36-761(+)